MVSRDRVIRTLNHQPIDRAPRDLWLAPGMEAERPDDVAEINVRFPGDFLHLETCLHAPRRSKTQGQRADCHVDAWGCTWKTDPGGAGPVLATSPLSGAAAAALTAFRPPAELLESARFAKVNAACDSTARFTLAGSEIRPLERLCRLRGREAALRELGEGNVELRDLLVHLHEHFRGEAQLWANTRVDGVILGDDMAWAAESPGNLKLWRAILKPMLRDYCAILHGRDKFVFFRAEGPVGDALDDLIEMGIDALHADWPHDEFVELTSKRRGQITFWSGIENRRLESPGSPAGVRDAVLRVRKAADYGAGGIISQAAWSANIPLKNIAAFFEQWLVPLPVTV